MNPCPSHDRESHYPACQTCPPSKAYLLGERLRAITEMYPMPVVFCRLTVARAHTGVLHSSHGSQGVFARVRDSKRGPRSQYQGVFERHLANGQFEVKVGGRYEPFSDEIADSLGAGT